MADSLDRHPISFAFVPGASAGCGLEPRGAPFGARSIRRTGRRILSWSYDRTLRPGTRRRAWQSASRTSTIDDGLAYAEGRGVPQDDAQALVWLRKAADQGSADAQGVLGKMYRDGRGVPQDYVRAHMWLNLAASLSDDVTRQLAVKVRDDMRQEAAKARDEVAAKMTPFQIVEAQRMAGEWIRAHESPATTLPIQWGGRECRTNGQRRRNVQGPSNNQWSTDAQIRRG